MPLPIVHIVTTGGTIASRIDPASGAAVPALGATELLAQVSDLAAAAAVRVTEFGLVGGWNMTPSLMTGLARTVGDILAVGDVTGVVVTHGTDTMEETAFALDLLLAGPAPVVLTGAMRNASQPGADGPHNLLDAVRVAADPNAAGLGVLVALNGEVHAARHVTKTHTTDAYAQDAGMATEAFAEFVFAACKLDQPDPAAAWRTQAAEQQRLIDWLAGKRAVRIVAPDTDLTLSVAGRIWLNADGRRNFPDGEIFTGPVEDATEGHVRFSYPVVTAGREIEDVRLRFAGGKVVDASAAKNEAFLLETLDADPGARALGELAFGTNFGLTRFTKNILFDEKIGGTVHMAIGAGYPETGSTNRSAVHWDLICDLREVGSVEVDGEPFLRNGRFVV